MMPKLVIITPEQIRSMRVEREAAAALTFARYLNLTAGYEACRN